MPALLLSHVPMGVKDAAETLGVVVLCGLACVYAIFFFRFPGVLLLGYAATRPVVAEFVHTPLFGSSTGLGKAWSIVLFILVVLYLVKALWERRESLGRLQARGRRLLRDEWLRGAWSLGPPLILIVAYFALTLGRPDRHAAVQFGGRMATWLLLLLAIGYLARSTAGQVVTAAAGFACAIVAIVAVGHAMLVSRYGAAYYFGAYGTAFTGQKPFGLAAVTVLTVPFVLLAVMWRRSLVLSWTLLALLAGAVVLSFVRVSYAALAITVVAFLLLGLKRWRRVAAISIALVAGVVVIGLTLFGGEILNRFTAGSGRFRYWGPVWHGTIGSVHASLIGRGAGASIQMIRSAISIPAWSHNDFLEMFAVGGVVLLACYLLVIIWLAWPFWQVFRDRRQSQLARDFALLCLAALCGFCILSFGFGIVFSLSALPMAFLAGLARGMATTPGATLVDVGDPLLAPQPLATPAPHPRTQAR